MTMQVKKPAEIENNPLLSNPLSIDLIRGSDRIIANAPSSFGRIRHSMDCLMEETARQVLPTDVGLLNQSAARKEPNTSFAFQSELSRRVKQARMQAQVNSKVGSVSIPPDAENRLQQEFEKETPLSRWGVERREIREKMIGDIVLWSVALSIQDSDGKVTHATDLSSAEIISLVRKAVSQKKKQSDKGGFSAAEYLTSRGVNKRLLMERGLCQDGSQPWHTGPDGHGLEILMPLGMVGGEKIEGQQPGGPPTIFDREWEKLGYSQAEVDRFRANKMTWWHNAETLTLLNLQSTFQNCLGKKPTPEEIQAKRADLTELIGQKEDAFKTFTAHQAYKPALDKMGFELKELLKLGITKEQALKLGYSSTSIKEA